MTAALTGTYIHRSYRNDVPDAAGTGTTLAALWAPDGTFDVTTEEDGTVKGKLSFSEQVQFEVTGKIQPAGPATQTTPALPLVELTAVMGPVKYHLRGWMIPEQDVVAGTVVAVSNDLRKAPDGTLGSWVLARKD